MPIFIGLENYFVTVLAENKNVESLKACYLLEIIPVTILLIAKAFEWFLSIFRLLSIELV